MNNPQNKKRKWPNILTMLNLISNQINANFKDHLDTGF